MLSGTREHGDVTGYRAMVTLYLMIVLDMDDARLSDEMIDSLTLNSAVSVDRESAVFIQEPYIRECIVQKVVALLSHHEPSQRKYCQDELASVIEKMVKDNILLRDAGLGECAEPMLCRDLLFRKRKWILPSISLWDLLKDYPGYIETYAKDVSSPYSPKRMQ